MEDIKATQEKLNELQKLQEKSIKQIEFINNNPIILGNIKQPKTPNVPQYTKKISENTEGINLKIAEIKSDLNKCKTKENILFWISISGFIIAAIGLFFAIATYVKTF